MKKIGIVVDSTSGLTEKEAEALGYGFISVNIMNGEEQYEEGKTIFNADVDKMLKENKLLTTSQPSYGQIEAGAKIWNKKFEKYVVICMAKGVSGTYDALTKFFEGQEEKVQVIDTHNCAYGIVWIADKVKQWQKEGITDFKEIVKKANNLKNSYMLSICPENLKQLKKGGRVPGLTAAIADIMGIKPILEMRNKLEKAGKARGFKKAYTKMIDMILKLNPNPDVGVIIHFMGTKENLDLAKSLYEARINKEVKVVECSSAIGVHTGSNTLGIGGYWE